MEEILLDLKNVRKQYANFSLECSMQVKRGSITGLIGANGAGKTTIFKASLGLIYTDGGEIRMMGKTPQQLTNEEWEKIGVVLSDATFPNILTAEDAGAILKKMYHRFDKADFEEKCRTFAIPMNKKMKEMSTGMKAKLKILMAMSHQAEILILDEPTSGLDVMAREGILDALRAYMEQEERAILISSHISGDLENLCDDLYLIDQGKIRLHEDTDVLLDQYGILKVTESEFAVLDKQYILASVMTSVAISTISYDSMDNGNSFLFTLPVRRKDYATEKYFFVCGFGAVSALIVAIACGILLLVRKSEMTADAFGVETMICLLIVLLLADLLVPLQIKFGAEKSKIVILATVGILVLGFEIMKNLDQYMQGISSWGRNLWQIISSYKILFGIAGILLVALLTFISWTISCRVLEKQEM